MFTGKNSQNRMCQSMVHNPIYSGPEYESIHPQYESMKLVPQQKHTIGEITPGSCDQISIPSTEKPCHFDQPLNQKDSQFPSSFASCYSP